jgi:hypothetical protein
MKFETPTRRLRDLLEEFTHGAILLPQFQRNYVWTSKKIRNLLDSLLKGFPIGGFYIWRPNPGTKTDPKPKAYGEKITVPFQGYLIDGQQRLTSLEAAYGLFAGEDKGGAELRCYLDLAADDDAPRVTRIFVSHAGNQTVAYRWDINDPTLIALKSLYDGLNQDLRAQTRDNLRLLPGWDPKSVDKALERFDAACQMLNQGVPVTTVSDADDKEAIEVFRRLNKGGTALTQGDVHAAELARGPAVKVLKRMREFVSGERPQRLGFGFSFAFRALVVFHRENARFSTLPPAWINDQGPHGRQLADSWHAANLALGEALSFVDKSMGWSLPGLLPSANAVVVLAAALDKARLQADTHAEQLYRRWLCLTALRGAFQGSVETTINRFLRAIRKSKNYPAKALVDALTKDQSRKIHRDEFKKPAQPWGPPTQVMLAWLVARKAKDWRTNDLVDVLARAASKSLPAGDLTVHHLFPRAVLASFLEDPDEANSPANYGLLSRSTNSEFGDKLPGEVWGMLTPDQRNLAALQLFDEGAGDRLEPDNYKDFCEWRATQLAESINDWLGID